jgi:HAD superfamily hydrolase (TIGR01509 family)
MNHAIEAVFWDMDGTLLDNDALYEEAIDKTLRAHNLTLLGDFPTGTCFEEHWKLMMQEEEPPQVPYAQWMDEMHHYCGDLLGVEHIRPGIVEVLQAILDADLAQACVSNAESYIVQKYFAKTGLTLFFNAVVGRDHVSAGKPSPAPYLKACEVHRKLPHRCLAIEDSEVGVKAAKAAGLNVIAYPNAQRKSCNFSKADHVIEHPYEILEILGLNKS